MGNQQQQILEAFRRGGLVGIRQQGGAVPVLQAAPPAGREGEQEDIAVEGESAEQIVIGFFRFYED